jgi:hypothetical protein
VNFQNSIDFGVAEPKHQLLPELSFNYGNLDFNSRTQVLATAKALEHWCCCL